MLIARSELNAIRRRKSIHIPLIKNICPTCGLIVLKRRRVGRIEALEVQGVQTETALRLACATGGVEVLPIDRAGVRYVVGAGPVLQQSLVIGRGKVIVVSTSRNTEDVVILVIRGVRKSEMPGQVLLVLWEREGGSGGAVPS